jgi:hypothetical protein
MKRLILLVLFSLFFLGVGGFTSSFETRSPSASLISPSLPEIACQSALDDLYTFASTGLGYLPNPISKIIQVYGIAPDNVLVPSGVIMNFEDSPIWYGKQQPFDLDLKWGLGGYCGGESGAMLTGVLIPAGGTMADFKIMEGKMTPKLVPWEGAEETGALVIKPADPDNNKTWTYVYSTYLPENWDCNAGSVFP